MIRCSPLITLPFPLKTSGFHAFSFFPLSVQVPQTVRPHGGILTVGVKAGA